MATTYLDSSALVKLVMDEPESGELRSFLRRRRPWASSALARTEVLRALIKKDEQTLRNGRRVLSNLTLIRVNDRILNAAGTLRPPELRSLDAIHLTTARDLGDELGTFVTYDDKMTDAARQIGLRVSAPQ